MGQKVLVFDAMISRQYGFLDGTAVLMYLAGILTRAALMRLPE